MNSSSAFPFQLRFFFGRPHAAFWLLLYFMAAFRSSVALQSKAAQSLEGALPSVQSQAAQSSLPEFLGEFLGDELLTKDGMQLTHDRLNGKRRVGLFFCAHWAPPCLGRHLSYINV